MDNIIFQPHILIDNNNEELFKEFIDAVEKTIENNKYLLLPPALNYINEKRRRVSLQNMNDKNVSTLTHFCSEGICNYYHYKITNNSVYIIKESISHTDLHDRLYCYLEVTN